MIKKIMLLALAMLLGGIALAGMPMGHAAPQVQGNVRTDAVISASSTQTVNFSSGNSIIQGFLAPMFGFFQSILNGVSNLLNLVLGGVGASIAQIFANWGYSVSGQTGIFAPIAMVMILGATGAVAYLFLGFYGGEKDVVSAEEEV